MFSWLTPASRFLGSSLHAADYFIDILNTDIFRKHSASDSPGSVFHILLHFLWLASEDVADFLLGWRREENKAKWDLTRKAKEKSHLEEFEVGQLKKKKCKIIFKRFNSHNIGLTEDYIMKHKSSLSYIQYIYIYIHLFRVK